ncbi:MAG TPA: SDR family oxidoreductase [Candidatus Aphodousia faecipullorum]|nr:SDR family oxidoreductase [Candidatus Aphodousia faecipullorum]
MFVDNKPFLESDRPIALITGASGGLGREFAKLLAHEGFRLILLGRNEEKLSVVVQHLNAPTMIFELDFTAPLAIQQFDQWKKTHNIHIDLLINNAGWGKVADVEHTTDSEILSMIDVDIRAVTLLTRSVLEDMLHKQSGKILNVASIASFLPCPGFTVYAASKAYVLSFSEALREEVSGRNITVTALCPGPVDTDFWHRAGLISTRPFETFLLSPSRVAQIGLAALFKGKAVCVPGIFNKILVTLSGIAPRFLVRAICSKIIAWASQKNGKNLHFSKH